MKRELRPDLSIVIVLIPQGDESKGGKTEESTGKRPEGPPKGPPEGSDQDAALAELMRELGEATQLREAAAAQEAGLWCRVMEQRTAGSGPDCSNCPLCRGESFPGGCPRGSTAVCLGL